MKFCTLCGNPLVQRDITGPAFKCDCGRFVFAAGHPPPKFCPECGKAMTADGGATFKFNGCSSHSGLGTPSYVKVS